jgi:hypothetical protein
VAGAKSAGKQGKDACACADIEYYGIRADDLAQCLSIGSGAHCVRDHASVAEQIVGFSQHASTRLPDPNVCRR